MTWFTGLRRVRRIGPRSVRRDERGASLILALMFTTSIAFMVAASLDFAWASFGQSNGTTQFRNGMYAAEGSARTLIAAMRSDATWGRDGSKCPGVTLAVGDGRDAEATCTPTPGSGALLTGGSGARTNRVVDIEAAVGPKVVVHARVMFNDGGGSSPGTGVTVLEWSSAL